MDDLRSKNEGSVDEVQTLKRKIRILLIIILVLLALLMILGYFLIDCMSECGYLIPITGPSITETTAPSETAVGIQTLPPQVTKTPTKTPTITPTMTPTKTFTPTPDLNATATAACSDFMEQFPGTPCP
jgi:hypothetical protein